MRGDDQDQQGVMWRYVPMELVGADPLHHSQRAAADGAAGLQPAVSLVVGLEMDDPVWNATVFTKNREACSRGTSRVDSSIASWSRRARAACSRMSISRSGSVSVWRFVGLTLTLDASRRLC